MMNTQPINRVHMVDASRQTIDERTHQAQKMGDFIAGLIVGAICFGAIVAIVVRLGSMQG